MSRVNKFVKENMFLSISVFLFLIILLIIALAYGSFHNKNEDESSGSDYNKPSSMLEEDGKSAHYTKVHNTSCDALKGVVYANENRFVTEIDDSYYLYEYVLGKRYSDETNCRLLEKIDKKPILFTYDSVFWGDSSTLTKTYYIVYEDLSYAQMSSPNEYNQKRVYSSNTTKGTVMEDGSYTIEGPSYSYEEVKWRGETNSYKIKNIFLDTHQNGLEWIVYKYAISYTNSISHKIFLELTVDEPIRKYLDGAVVTDRAIYTWGLLDDSCLTYADVECEEGFPKNYDLTERYEEILFVNRQFVVFKNGETYQYQSK